jgi:hypothetical protein
MQSVPKAINNKSNIQINKQDELDELDELNELSNLLETHSNSSKISTKGNEFKNFIQPKGIASIKMNKPMSNDTIKLKKIKSQLIEQTSDLYDNLENELLPKNFGNKWTDEDKNMLITLLKQSANNEIDYANIALKLARSEGGVKGEVKKMIITRYLNGEGAELIATDMNVQYKFVKILIKLYIENDIDTDINNLEKENKLLKLKMENMELRKNIYNLTKK